eukprot:TRINITY_DN2230_c0_g1_i1.p1 TRINITY_DN2230_c0_g1~~TRINITY_DN2230_c0_g1_i1.p1  ORF type:complete len:600 (-),score=140.95 TRINITY_DN2230_c0_g1_i1:26-1801(-)
MSDQTSVNESVQKIIQQALHQVRFPPVPTEHELQVAIEKLATFTVAQGVQGIQLEGMVKIKEQNNPQFKFLYGGPYHDYYQFQKMQIAINGVNEVIYKGQPVDTSQPYKNLIVILSNLNFIQTPGLQHAAHQIKTNLHNLHQQRSHMQSQMQPPPPPPLQQQQQQQPQQNLPPWSVSQQSQSQSYPQQTTTDAKMTEADANNNPTTEHVQLSESDYKEITKILEELNGSADRIKNAKNWVLDRVSSSFYILKAIHKHIVNGEPKKKLFYVYLLNDCLHHSLKSREHAGELDFFSEVVLDHLVPLLSPAYHDQPEEIRSKVEKVLALWHTRGIFKEEDIKYAKENLDKEPIPFPLEPPKPQPPVHTNPTPPPSSAPNQPHHMTTPQHPIPPQQNQYNNPLLHHTFPQHPPLNHAPPMHGGFPPHMPPMGQGMMGAPHNPMMMGGPPTMHSQMGSNFGNMMPAHPVHPSHIHVAPHPPHQPHPQHHPQQPHQFSPQGGFGYNSPAPPASGFNNVQPMHGTPQPPPPASAPQKSNMDPNYNLPVGLLVDNFKRLRQSQYEPIDANLLIIDTPTVNPQDHQLKDRFEEFLAGLPQ